MTVVKTHNRPHRAKRKKSTRMQVKRNLAGMSIRNRRSKKVVVAALECGDAKEELVEAVAALKGEQE